MPEEVKAKIRAKHVGKKLSIEHRQKMSAAKKGKPLTSRQLEGYKNRSITERQAAMYASRRGVVLGVRICDWCGKSFEYSSKTARNCSVSCKAKAWRARRSAS